MEPIPGLNAFYENEGQEELRLQEEGIQYLEYLTATRYLERHLPPAGRVLDSCAGTGVYAFWLAEKGYGVAAGDVVPYNVELMEEKQRKNPVLESVFLGDARALSSFEDGCFDAVLCMGALYHLHREEDRRQALAESLRLLRPGGVLACTYMNRHAVIANNCKGDVDDLADIMTFLREGREGVFYASTPREMKALLGHFPLKELCHVALDGLSTLLGPTAGLVSGRGLARLREYHLASCEEESLLGYSYHCLYMGRKCPDSGPAGG